MRIDGDEEGREERGTTVAGEEDEGVNLLGLARGGAAMEKEL